MTHPDDDGTDPSTGSGDGGTLGTPDTGDNALEPPGHGQETHGVVSGGGLADAGEEADPAR